MSRRKELAAHLLLIAILTAGAISYHSYETAAPPIDYTNVVPE